MNTTETHRKRINFTQTPEAFMCPENATEFGTFRDQAHVDPFFDDHEQEAKGEALDMLTRIMRLAREDAVQLLILLLSIPEPGETPIKNPDLAMMLQDIGTQFPQDTYNHRTIARRRQILAYEFPEVRGFLCPGRGVGRSTPGRAE